MIDPTEKALAISPFRMRFLRLLHGASDETTDDSVPAERRDAFNVDVAYNKEFAERWFERACRSFGATDGTWATVPEENHADALRWFGRKMADYENRCEYEYDLKTIDLDQAAEKAFDEAMTLARRK